MKFRHCRTRQMQCDEPRGTECFVPLFVQVARMTAKGLDEDKGALEHLLALQFDLRLPHPAEQHSKPLSKYCGTQLRHFSLPSNHSCSEQTDGERKRARSAARSVFVALEHRSSYSAGFFRQLNARIDRTHVDC